MMEIGTLLNYAAWWVFGFSILSLVLPPVELFDDFPRFQKYYRLLGKIVKYMGSLDFRTKILELYPSYRKKNGDQSEST